ncbi:MAG: hypothetical protein JRJ51_23680, partial [Deltaproteobacteria bacterium]|nr:hypothetical protein [Deltaproteobacteria bacterium]
VNEGTWGIIFVGLIECLVIGWAFDIGKLRRHANQNSDWKLGKWWEWFIRLFIPVILAGLVIWSLVGDIRGPSMLIDASELTEPNTLAFTLLQGDDPVSQHLKKGCSPETKRMLEKYPDPNQPIPQELKTALADELSQVIEGPYLYEKERFNSVKLSEDTQALLNPAADGKDLIRINRYLLQDAYAKEIKPTQNKGGFLIDFRGRLIGKNVLGMCLMFMVFLTAVILALWRPRKTAKIPEYDT